MRKEGYDDSDTNENYRCMVKNYQKKMGTLPSVQEFKTEVQNNQLASIKEEIGNMKMAKLELQEQARSTNKLIRETGKNVLLIESIEKALRDNPPLGAETPKVQEDNPFFVRENKSAIVCLSDIHYGAEVDLLDNVYNTSVAKIRLRDYLSKVVKRLRRENVTAVHVVNLGDIIENAYMRSQNLFDVHLNLSEQIVQVTDLIIEFLSGLQTEFGLITYQAIAGNHDRLQGNKDNNLNADHAVNISNQIIKTWIRYSGASVELLDNDGYFADLDVMGYKFAFVHGDRNNLNKKTMLAEISSTHDVNYDCLIGGHIHHFTENEVGLGKHQVTFGSVKGIDDYSIRINAKSTPSQGFVIVSKEGYEVRKVEL